MENNKKEAEIIDDVQMSAQVGKKLLGFVSSFMIKCNNSIQGWWILVNVVSLLNFMFWNCLII